MEEEAFGGIRVRVATCQGGKGVLQETDGNWTIVRGTGTDQMSMTKNSKGQMMGGSMLPFGSFQREDYAK
eukprot:9462842-Ditylum_brightwellii.AAC.1